MGHPYTAQPVTLDSTGAGTIGISPDKAGVAWSVYQLCITSVPGGLLSAQILVDSMPMGTPTLVLSGAAASGYPPIPIEQSQTLQVQVIGGPPGAQLQLTALYTEYELAV